MTKSRNTDARERRKWRRILSNVFAEDKASLRWPSRGNIQRIAVEEFCAPLEHIILTAWAFNLPEHERRSVADAVRLGILTGCSELMRDIHATPFQSIRKALFSVEPYWEQPITPNEPKWPLHRLQAYRWAAALIAYSVRAELEPLHAKYTSDDSMPFLNRSLRNTLYAGLLRIPALGTRLSLIPLAYIEARALGGNRAPLPFVVGNELRPDA